MDCNSITQETLISEETTSENVMAESESTMAESMQIETVNETEMQTEPTVETEPTEEESEVESELESEEETEEESTEDVIEEETETDEAEEFEATSGNFIYSVSGSRVSITGYTGRETNITIPSKLGGYTVTQIGDYTVKDGVFKINKK